jgi:xanthine dehydrogenase YagT iron-sulfur-binding subunit
MPSPFEPDPDLPQDSSAGAGAFTRRGFLQSALVAATIAEVPQALAMPLPASRPERSAPAAPAQPVTLNINGQERQMMLEPRVTLLDALRETAGLTGTKKGCDRGQCGACTVLLDGRRVNACLTLAVMAEGRRIVTVEGLANGEQLSPLQAQFIEQDAFQCGYCTPGQLCSATALLEELRAGRASAATADVRAAHAPLTDEEIRERMSGNLCRCGAYPNIVRAIRIVAAGGLA